MRPGVGQDAPETGGSDTTVVHWLRDSEAATPSWGKDGPGEVTPPGGAGRRVPEGLDLDVRDEAHLGPQSSEPLDRVGSLGPGGSRPGAQGEWDAPLASGESGASVGLGERGRGPAPNEAASKANAETTFEEMEEKKAREQAREKAEAEIGGADERLREPASPAVGFGSGHTGGPRKGEDSELVAATDANSSHLQRRGEACETALGGVLYLLNVMKQLKLPDSFEADWALDSHLGAWGCLQAIAIGLLAASGCTGGAMASTERRIPIVDPTTVWSDPIWRLLAELDGREPGQPLGANVIDPGVFVTPLEWNKWVGQGGLGRGVAASVIDAGKGAFPISAALLKWIASATPYINEFVRIAAGPLGTAELDPASLLFVRASVYASATHVDMVAGLDEISLAARIAGLDRDPGWDPKCARVVQFYFR